MSRSGAICLAIYQPDRDLLRAQIESLAMQTETDWDCHIGIDGRDDSVADYLAGLVGTDARFSITMYETNVGFYRNFERLVEEVSPTAEWVALADQDDWWFPG
ncbi:glycosyltransferase [Aeromicrobium sp. UC242_57]|uniref:glycosyltransferase n=1 Tax=Aeromicrobium sp. UC242_57 TaxID=3374624 RepID=UPI003787B362